MDENSGLSSEPRVAPAALFHGCDSAAEILPMGPLPKSPVAPRALEKLSILLCNEWGDEGNCFVVRDRCKDDVAVCTAIGPQGGEGEVQVKVQLELMQLAADDITEEERVTSAEELAQHETAIAGEEPSTFLQRALHQRLVGDDLLIGGVIAENAQPACQAAEHRIGNERLYRNEKWRPAPLVSNHHLFPFSRSCVR